MGISISIPCDTCINKVFYWLEKKVGYIRNLKKNLVALDRTIAELKAKRDNLSRNFSRAEDRGLERPAGFQEWFDNVETVEQRVNDLLSDRDVQLQRRCLCGFCSKNPKSGYHYGKKVFLMLREVEELQTRDFDVIAEQAQTRVVQERSIPPIIVGQETMLDKAWNHLMEDGVGIMGMYGMGGVGKTTLLTQINNKFGNDRRGFDYVIWVVVSKELNVEKIQNEIAKKVGLGGGDWKQKEQSEKIDDIYNFLRRKKFVLLLDDIWEKVDLREIGVPFPTIQNRCKVAFTTRSQDVCARMGVADSMEVKCLMDNVAFDLFQKRVGQKTLDCDPGIPDLARTIARKCCGLPLALNVIGETMACKKTIQEWRNAIDVLNSYATEFEGMDDKILPILKYSYDSLKGEHVKSCLLYCALYPEDAKILNEKLIEYWICEEIIDGSEGIERAEDKGYDIIGSLVGASLLMEGVDAFGKACVIMHDVVREMALWIASELGIQKEAFIVRAGVGLSKIPKVKNWNVVRRMSLMENKIYHLDGNPECLQLKTLLLQNTTLENISSGFFKYMPKLAVLDLSGYQSLSELPEEISNLVSLQYLNLGGTKIHHLPKGLQELKKIIHLDLEHTWKLESIDGISSLHDLKVLKLFGSSLPWDLETVKELEALDHLEVLTTIIDPGPEQFLSSHRLMSRTRVLMISGKSVSSKNRYLESSGISLPISMEYVSSLNRHLNSGVLRSGTMDKLRELKIRYCSISELKMGRICSFLRLVKVHIDDCEGLRELTFLMFAPNLRTLDVSSVKDLEDIINTEKACEGVKSGIVPFEKLKDLFFIYSTEAEEYLLDSSTISMFRGNRIKKMSKSEKAST